jgi:hypothetical protein
MHKVQNLSNSGIKIPVFWDVCRQFGKSVLPMFQKNLLPLISSMKMEAAGCSDASTTYRVPHPQKQELLNTGRNPSKQFVSTHTHRLEHRSLEKQNAKCSSNAICMLCEHAPLECVRCAQVPLSGDCQQSRANSCVSSTPQETRNTILAASENRLLRGIRKN